MSGNYLLFFSQQIIKAQAPQPEQSYSEHISIKLPLVIPDTLRTCFPRVAFREILLQGLLNLINQIRIFDFTSMTIGVQSRSIYIHTLLDVE